ncbi:PREDICTED: probable 2-oxoglutarate-dependent dioxygenase AOP1 [Lupinus angustifolius]|uniref:probable 2-oxoglutarate-dependent dioxygenase AOP1 n=1 Tax=Lupinus angustifolius TaxID=3871 RepID=UPI00092E1F8E|nr:PREDICTED: probable 2-oxoglutarate-dependent dioxygenase AOP1 [Lupinus angustifolius]
MGSETIPMLPIIDFTNLKSEGNINEWEAVKSQVHKAVVEYGCFEAKFDKIPLDLCKDIFASLQELFDLPLQTKVLNVSKKPYHGYVGQYPIVPLYESIGIDDANVYDKVENMANILWHDGNPSFSKTIQSFSGQVSELDQIIRKMILESLGVEKYLEEHMNSSKYLLRVMKYKGPQTSETKLGLNSHTDKNIVTILHQNQVEGLEVLTKDGKWISYKPSPNSFVAMIGDSLHAWSNGRLHSPFHRVMMSGNEARYCIGLFSIPKEGYIIKAPMEMVDEEHPQLFKPYDHFDFLNYYYTKEGQADQFALTTFCGVN